MAVALPEIASRFVDCHVFRRRGAAHEWLVLKRAAHVRVPGSWQMVSGCIEAGEKAYETAVRELREETSLVPVHLYQASFLNRFYLAESDEVMLTPVFAVEVAPDAEVRLSDEHTEYAWVSADDATRRFPWPGQRESLRIIREQFLDAEIRKESCLDHLLDGAQRRR